MGIEMKIKTILVLSFLITQTITSMEQKDIGLRGMLLQPASLKFLAAWQASQNPIGEGTLPEEVLEYVDKIKTIQACTKCTIDEKKLFINLINNPDIDIEKFFPRLIQKYLKSVEFTNKQQLLNAILIESLIENNQPIVHLSLYVGADVNIIHDFKALMEAVMNGHQDIVIGLLDKANNTGNKSKLSRAVLMLATISGQKEMVQMLIDRHVNINKKNRMGTTALMLAVYNDHEEIVEMLLANGADINPADNNGYTALMIAAAGNRKDIVQMLLNSNANINLQNNNGNTALMLAAYNGHKKIVQLLLHSGADVNIENQNGYSALAMAIHQGHNELVDILEAYK